MNESKEMYLESILMLSKEKANVKSIDIARFMNFSKPTVSIAVKKLKTDNLITVDDHGFIKLTKKGLKIAESILEKHEIITELLIKIGVDKDIAENDACKIEHTISDETFEKLKNIVKKI